VTDSAAAKRLLGEAEAAGEEMVAFAAELIRIPTVNPPGSEYRRCAETIGRRMVDLGFDVEYLEATERPEHSAEYPRVNVIGTIAGGGEGRCVHLNGHFDVVPPGDGWTVDPFGGLLRDGRLYGRGSADMKSGLAAALYAAAAFKRAGIEFPGSIEVSGTVDEESGGFAGVGHLAESGRVHHARTDYVIIPEPFGIDGISLGHRGVYWFKITAKGRTGHGSMPFLGRSAIDDLGAVLTRVREQLAPQFEHLRTTMPITPDRARLGSINVNSILGGQWDADSNPEAPVQTPCVADHAEAVFDRRFLVEERFEEVRGQISSLLADLEEEDPERRYELTDLMVVEPTMTPPESPLVRALERSVRTIVGHDARLVASPGTYDQKHVARIAGIEHCVAYGPGELEQAHQPDESCAVEDIVTSAKIMALAALELVEG